MKPVAVLRDRRKKIQIYRKEIEIEEQNPFDWLRGQRLFPKFYWAHRSDPLTIATAGRAASFLHFPRIEALEETSLRIYGWRHFTPSKSPEWLLFPEEYYFLPRFELLAQSGKTILAIHSLDPSFPSPHPSKFLVSQPLHWISKTLSPSQNRWNTLVDASPVKKVVLARRVTLENKEPIDPLPLIANVDSKNTYRFFIQKGPHLAFFGASPETLYRRSGRSLESEAIAGTHHNSAELLSSAKDEREVSYVSDALSLTLAPFCTETPTFSSLSTIQAGELNHLYRNCQVTLKEGISDASLLSALHPTPAVGGYPRKEALDYLFASEPFDRGLYAAPLGWASQDASEWVVAIRSALVEGNRLHLYSGAGIVEGSLPDKEWQELDHKLRWLKLDAPESGKK